MSTSKSYTRPTANKAAVLYAPRDLRLESWLDPVKTTLSPTQVLIEMRAVGICGSDVHYLAHFQCGPFKVKDPMVLGHECAGRVIEVGSAVKNLTAGDRVAIEPGVPCRHCELCKKGLYNLCEDITFYATPPYHGSLSQYAIHESDFCFKLPSHVSYEEGALLEPLSVGMQAIERTQVFAGSRVLILGAGPVGLATLLCARAAGATDVGMIDIRANRLEVAKKLGATRGFLFSDKWEYPSNEEKVDIVIDCSGNEGVITKGVKAIKSGGKMGIVGRGPSVGVKNFPLFELADKEIDVIGVFRYRNVYAKALNLVSSGTIDVKGLVTHRFNLDEVVKAFDVSEHGRDGAIKVMVIINDTISSPRAPEKGKL